MSLARNCLIMNLPNNTESHPVHRYGLYTAVKLNTSSCFCSIFHYTNISCQQTIKQIKLCVIILLLPATYTVKHTHCQEICCKTCEHCTPFARVNIFLSPFVPLNCCHQALLTKVIVIYLYKDPVKFAPSVK